MSTKPWRPTRVDEAPPGFNAFNTKTPGRASTAEPEGRSEAPPRHEVKITFVKSGRAGVDVDVDVEGRRADESDWRRLAFDGYSPYIDNRPPLNGGLPEQRRYRLRYRDRDTPVGEFSDVFVVTTEA